MYTFAYIGENGTAKRCTKTTVAGTYSNQFGT